jgi:phosphopantothenoylcysteine decarboxylase/phosphopantothenate--cysteine ligase
VTAGPTREALDAVRFLTNASTGRMGWEIAREARRRGARTTLLLGPSTLPDPAGVRTVRVVSTAELLREARRRAPGSDLVVFAAAPADWRPARARRGKPPREGGSIRLVLRPTPDIAATLVRSKGARVHVGFALEVGGGERRARAKLLRKGFDAVVLNGPENLGAGGGAVWWIPAKGPASRLPSSSKRLLARRILDRAVALLAPARAATRRGGGSSGRR